MSDGIYHRSLELLRADASRLLIIDMQERLLPVIKDQESVLENCVKLAKGAQLLNVPLSATEQYPRGLGATVGELIPLLPERPEKLRFSSAEVLEWGSGPQASGEDPLIARTQVVIAGIETHVCVLQTAFDLQSAGYDVFVVADAVGSRRDLDREIALQRMSDGGIRIVTCEMVLFEWCEVAGTDTFKQLSRLVTGR